MIVEQKYSDGNTTVITEAATTWAAMAFVFDALQNLQVREIVIKKDGDEQS